MRLSFLIPCVLLALTGVACGGESSEGQPVDEADDLKSGSSFTEADNGKTVSVPVGQSFSIYLNANPTNEYGFKWIVTKIDRTLGQPKETFVRGDGSGSGRRARFTWSGQSPFDLKGSHDIELQYMRGEDESRQTFKLTVVIGEAAQAGVTITKADDGKSINVPSGQNFTISLPSNATTGYKWQVTLVDKSLGYPKEEFVSPTGTGLGAAGKQNFTWSTKSPLRLDGEHLIQLKYVRPWQETAPAADTFNVTVVIGKASNGGDTLGKQCGGLLGTGCNAGQFCDITMENACNGADLAGKCTKVPEACAEVYMPVCGCNGRTYSNDCDRQGSQVQLAHKGECN